ncbi:GNAT family N-acetyltransferase [Chitinophaga pinensis]|uniref:GNAT family N-acetyltransferase n=1 Tax=Chitinophaga pinensis TaxID=79329 RepID=A0A5C6LLU9_9BACT|nr:GNAT family N-acetyltransferase [Chitinophaga pinensis]TWV96879.1 GNAT family N-acetyltransferase [Chitinophaga pinensis]
MPVTIRNISPADNAALAAIIRNTFDEFDTVPKTGTVYSDPETDHLSDLFQTPGSAYYIAEEDGVVLGGCGLFPTAGLPEGCVELVKYYLSSAARGKGLGKTLMEQTFEGARQLGYKEIYLESFPDFTKAISIYEKAGFQYLEKPLGNSGHFACTVWMLKPL